MNIQSLKWAAIGLCIVLAAISIFLFLRLRRFKAQQFQQEQARLDHWRESARIVAFAVVQQQCDLSEGCLRLRYILAQLNDQRALLEEMGEELKGFATHSARQELPIAERFRQDEMRLQIEARYSESMVELCREIAATYDFRGA